VELAIIRHAERDRRARDDAGLSPVGWEQARAAADRLHHEVWDALYTAPERCATDTAAVLAGRLGLVPRIERRLTWCSADQDAVGAIDGIIAAHAGQRVVIVTHSPVINAFVGDILGVSGPVVAHPAHTGITGVLAARTGQRELTCLNDSSHLRLSQRAPVRRSPV